MALRHINVSNPPGRIVSYNTPDTCSLIDLIPSRDQPADERFTSRETLGELIAALKKMKDPDAFDISSAWSFRIASRKKLPMRWESLNPSSVAKSVKYAWLFSRPFNTNIITMISFYITEPANRIVRGLRSQ